MGTKAILMRALEYEVGACDAKMLRRAIKRKIPIMIYDREKIGKDPILYRLLKDLGAHVVRNYDMTRERDGCVNGVYLTVFVEGHSNTNAIFSKAGDASDTLKQ